MAEPLREGDTAMEGENAPGHTVGLWEQVLVRWLIRSDCNTVARQIGWIKLRWLPIAGVGIVSPIHRGTVVFAEGHYILIETGKAEMVTGAEAAGAVVSEPVGSNRRRTAFAARRIVVLDCSHSCPSPLGSPQPDSSTPWSGCAPPAGATAYISPTRRPRIHRSWDPEPRKWRRLMVLEVRTRSLVDTSSAVHTAVVAVRHLPCH